MKQIQRSVFLSFLMLILLAPHALAEGNKTGTYLGFGAGQSAVGIAGQSLNFGNFDADADDTAWKAFVGFRPIRFLAFEGSYRDLGTPGDVDGVINLSTEVDGFDGALLGILPIGPIDLFVRGGVIWWDATVKINDGSGAERVAYSGEDAIYGAGVGLRLGSFGMRGEYEVIDSSEFYDLEMWSLNAYFIF